MNDTEIEALVKSIVDQKMETYTKEITLLRAEISELKEWKADQRVVNEKILGKLDLIQLRLEETKVLATETDKRGKLDIVSLITAVVSSAIMATAMYFLNKK